MGASSSRRGIKRRSLFNGSRNRNVPASSCAQSEPNAFADMHSTRTRERSNPSSIFAGMLSPGLSTHSSNQTRRPSPRRRSVNGRTTFLSFELWLRKTAYWKSIAIPAPSERSRACRIRNLKAILHPVILTGMNGKEMST